MSVCSSIKECKARRNEIQNAIELVNAQPPVEVKLRTDEDILRIDEAMPVVRCKECGHYDTTGFPALNPGTGWCDKMGKGVHDDFYCANGAKMEANQDE
jgi:hypothetical protein